MGLILTFTAIIYIVGILITFHTCLYTTRCSIENGKLDIKEVSVEATPKIAWKSVLWPAYFIIACLKFVTLILNDVVAFILLLLNIKYNRTRLYYTIKNMEI